MTKHLLELLHKNALQARAPKVFRGYRAAMEDPAEDDGDGNDSEDAADQQSDEATIFLYGAIGCYDSDLNDFVQEINGITAGTIHVRIHSPGGDVFDARVIKTALDQKNAKIICHIDGLAASAASFVMLAGDEIRIADGAMVMIHEPWGFAVGTAKDFRATANVLDKVKGVMVRDYMRKTGKTAAEIESSLAAETWFTADEAKAFGLVDVIDDFSAPQSALSFDLSAYENAPKIIAADQKQESLPDPSLIEALRKKYEARLKLYLKT